MTREVFRNRSLFKKIFDFFLGERSLGQLIRYLITGISSFILEYLLFYYLFRLLLINELIANSIALAIVFWFNFLMNRYWSFKSKNKLSKQLLLYGLLFAFNISISNVFIYGASVILGMSPLISKILIMCLIVLWNFILYKTVIYKK